jgi:hypothetical protein
MLLGGAVPSSSYSSYSSYYYTTRGAQLHDAVIVQRPSEPQPLHVAILSQDVPPESLIAVSVLTVPAVAVVPG